ncbi:unnamed protein product [Ectocarpus sp. 4 AP-2014]
MTGMQDKLTAPPEFDGPVRERKCTDIIFTLAIIIMWITMTAVGISSVQQGDVRELLAPTDYEGNLCGFDDGYEDLGKLYYANNVGSGVCVDTCPSTTDLTEVVCRYDRPDDLDDAEAVLAGYCNPQYESVEVVNYCVFTDTDTWDDVEQSDLANYLSSFIADVITARAYVFGFGFGVATLVAFVYIGLLQIPFLVAIVVWSCVLLVLLCLLGLGYGLWVTAVDWDDNGTKEDYIVTAAYVCAVVAWVLAFLWTCLFCFLAKRISLAIGVIKEAGRSIASMPIIVFWPVVELVASIAFVAIWMYYAAYTASLGDITTKTVESDTGGYDLSYKVYDFDQQVQYRGWFLLFCLFWTLNFVTAMGQIVIAMSVASWYFARHKNHVGSLTVVSSVGKTFTFHIGTAAFGGLIVAIVEMIRAILTYIQKKAEKSGNKVVQYIACCCVCCFWCLENCLRFINKNAYVQTAIFSTNFCTSARNAFYLIARNIARVAAVSILGEFVLNVMTVCRIRIHTRVIVALTSRLASLELLRGALGGIFLVLSCTGRTSASGFAQYPGTSALSFL